MRNNDYSKPIYSTSEVHCAVTEFHQPQGDLISREESKRINKALNIFRIWLKGQRTYVSREDAEYAYRTAIEYLNKYKPTVKQTEWISVKDGLPKEKGMYKITLQTDDGYRYVAEDYFFTERNFFESEAYYKGVGRKIIAWQPITEPSPYKGE